MPHPASLKGNPTGDSGILEGLLSGAWDGIKGAIVSIPTLYATLTDPQKRMALKKAFDASTPEGKQRILSTIGEVVGGGVGAYAGGGVASVPMAGGGAVLGKIAAEKVGELFGLPQDWQKQTGAERAHDLAQTFTGNAAGEGIGRTIPMVIAGSKNLIKAPFQPTPAAAVTNATADALNVPLTLAARTGSPRLGQLQTALSHHFAAGPVIQSANREGMLALENSFDNLFARINPASVSREQLADMLQKSLAAARKSADDKVGAQLDVIAGSLAPTMKPAQEVGRGLQAGLTANTKRLSQFANDAYKKLDEMGASVMVPFDSVVETSEKMLADHPDLIHYLPSEVRSLLKQTADLRKGAPKELNDLALSQAGTSYADLSGTDRAIVDSIAKRMGIDTTMPTGVEIPYPTAQRIKSQLGEMRAGLEVIDNPAKKHAFAAIANQADDVLKTKIPDQNLQALYNEVTQKFAKGVQATREPQVPGRPGNPMAKTIRESAAPEDLPNQLTRPYGASEIQQAKTATSPQSMAHLEPNFVPAGAPEPMSDVQRYAVENMRKRATVPTPEGGERVSPSALREQSHGLGAADTNKELLGNRFEDKPPTGPALSLGEVSNPTALAEEARLYESPLAKALDDPQDRANRAFNAALPPRAAGAAEATMELAGPTGRPLVGRALADDLMAQSQRLTEGRSVGMADRGALDPAVLKKKMDAFGETLDAPLGPANLQAMRDRIAVGEAIAGPHKLYGNTSRTAPIHQIMRGINRSAGQIGGALAGGGEVLQLLHHPAAAATAVGGAAGVLGIPYLLGKGITSPSVAKTLTGPLSPISAAGPLGAGIGTIDRAAQAINESDSSPAESDIPPFAIRDASIPPYAIR